MLFMYLLSCSQQATDANEILIDGEALTVRIERMEERRKKHEAELAEDMLVLIKRMEKLEARLKNAEIALTDFQEPTLDARMIVFDPRETKLDATTIQEALTALASKLSELEKQSQDFGQPGDGLFRLDHDQPGGRGPGGRGPGGGPGGPGGGPGGPGGGPGGPGGSGGGPDKGPGAGGENGPSGPPP